MNRTLMVSILVLSGPVSTAFAAASLTPLGFLAQVPPGYAYSIAASVNGDGTVVVGESRSGSGYEQAFRWTPGGGMVGLGTLPGTQSSAAYGVSHDGSVVVGVNALPGSGQVGNQAFRWSDDSGLVGLGFLPGSDKSSAWGVSGDGSVVVGRSEFVGGPRAFRWTPENGMVGLGLLPGAGDSAAWSVSPDGSIVVGDSGGRAFRWTAGAGMVELGGLPGGWGWYARDVNANGSVVVGFGGVADEAVRWTADGAVGLGHVPGGSFYSRALGVSGDGSVIVGFGDAAQGPEEAFRWTPGGGMERLWDVLLANGVNPSLLGWEYLLQATDVSADGNVIVGYGIHNSGPQGFVAVVPEPGSMALFAIVAPILLSRRHRGVARNSRS